MRTERLARALRCSGTMTIDDAVDVIDDSGGDREVGGDGFGSSRERRVSRQVSIHFLCRCC